MVGFDSWALSLSNSLPNSPLLDAPPSPAPPLDTLAQCPLVENAPHAQHPLLDDTPPAHAHRQPLLFRTLPKVFSALGRQETGAGPVPTHLRLDAWSPRLGGGLGAQTLGSPPALGRQGRLGVE